MEFLKRDECFPYDVILYDTYWKYLYSVFWSRLYEEYYGFSIKFFHLCTSDFNHCQFTIIKNSEDNEFNDFYALC